MKAFYSLLILFVCHSPWILLHADDFDKVIAQQKNIDPAMAIKLSTFAEGGLENHLDVGDVTPDQLIEAAKKYLGVRHCMGGTSMSCIDCSGLIYASFRDIGVEVPRTAEDLARYGEVIAEKSELQKGDLVFFVKTYKTTKTITHIGIFVGDGMFIHTSSSRGVMLSKIEDPYYWNDKYLYGTRIFGTHEKDSPPDDVVVVDDDSRPQHDKKEELSRKEKKELKKKEKKKKKLEKKRAKKAERKLRRRGH